MKRIINIIIIVIIVVVCVYKSVYIENLTERNNRLAMQSFSPEQIVEKFWAQALDSLLTTALDINTFDSLLKANPKELASKHGKTIGIGFPYSIFVKGNRKIESFENEQIVVKSKYAIVCGKNFSNTIREASGYFDIDAFQNTMDFNKVSSEINSRISQDIVTPVMPELKIGSRINFYGAVDIYPDRVSENSIKIVPLRLTVESDE